MSRSLSFAWQRQAREGRMPEWCRPRRLRGWRLSGPRLDADGRALGRSAQRSAARRAWPAGGVLRRHAGPQGRASAATPPRVRRDPPGRRGLRGQRAVWERPRGRGGVLDACAVPLMAELRAWLEGPRRRIFGECDRAKEIPSMVEGGRFDHGAGRRPRLPAQQGCARPWPSARSTAAGGSRSSPSWSAPRERNGWDPQGLSAPPARSHGRAPDQSHRRTRTPKLAAQTAYARRASIAAVVRGR